MNVLHSATGEPDADPHPAGMGGASAWKAVAVEVALPTGASVRGKRWGDDPAILLLHAPGPDRDLDDWRDLPATLTAGTGIGVLALDLPGHGLSDNAEAGNDSAGLLAALHLMSLGRSIRAVVAAGETAGALLAAGPALRLTGLVCFSPAGGAVAEPDALPRSSRLPKLLLTRSGGDGADVRKARAMAKAVGGWAVVVGVSGPEPGGALLDGRSGGAVRDHVAGFLRECLVGGSS